MILSSVTIDLSGVFGGRGRSISLRKKSRKGGLISEALELKSSIRNKKATKTDFFINASLVVVKK
jgi:hypothetical protein